jgi:KTSC domain
MERIAVSSSNIKEAGYDMASNTLELLFSDGRVYQYFDVPPAIYTDLINAPSAGKFFHASIRGSFRFARV